MAGYKVELSKLLALIPLSDKEGAAIELASDFENCFLAVFSRDLHCKQAADP
ncbi:hypothetical protein D3C85_1048840 [compost metagenome]